MTAIWYVLVKLVAYTAWCALGIGWLRTTATSQSDTLSQPTKNDTRSEWLSAIGFGVLRLFMGVFFGLLIWMISSALAGTMKPSLARDAAIYAAVYVPVRWIEWTILAWLIAKEFRKVSWLFHWSDVTTRWRLGGIVISCLADIPLIYSLGGVIPTGRFMC